MHQISSNLVLFCVFIVRVVLGLRLYGLIVSLDHWTFSIDNAAYHTNISLKNLKTD